MLGDERKDLEEHCLAIMREGDFPMKRCSRFDISLDSKGDFDINIELEGEKYTFKASSWGYVNWLVEPMMWY